VIREDNNIYGGAVNIASRISSLAHRARCRSRKPTARCWERLRRWFWGSMRAQDEGVGDAVPAYKIRRRD